MSQHLICTRATSSTCRRCRASVLIAYDEGEPVTADATAIAPQNEATILLQNRRTYTRTVGGYLMRREPAHIISGHPAGDIHPQHQCAVPTQREEAGQLRRQFDTARNAGKQDRHHARMRRSETESEIANERNPTQMTTRKEP